jgi:hypothetical protein
MIVLSDPLLFEVEHLLFAGGQRIEIQCARVTELEAAGRTDEASVLASFWRFSLNPSSLRSSSSPWKKVG